MKHVYGYIRVSTAKQGEGVSLEAQKEAIQAYADQRNLKIVRWFEEKETAAKSGRKFFTEMLKNLKAGKAEGLVIHKIDRSARNLKDWAKIGELSDLGIEVFFATETLDFRSRGGRLTADIQAVIAADYIRNLREETIKGIRGRLKQGLYPFNAPIGYLDQGKGRPKIPDPLRSHHVQTAYKLYATGRYTYQTLLPELEKRGFKSATGKPISKHGLERILSNPFYCGLIKIQRTGETFKGIHQPLVSVRLFEEVQAIKDGRVGKKVTRHDHLFRGLFRCMDCSGSMIPERQRGHVYYRCQTRACPTKTIRQEVLNDGIATCIANLAISDSEIDLLAARLQTSVGQSDEFAALQSLDAQIAHAEARLERLTDALIDRLIDQNAYHRRKETLELERAKLLEERERLANYSVTPADLRKFLEHAKTIVQQYEIVENDEKRQIVKLTTSNRFVSGKNLYIEPANWVRGTREAIAVASGDPGGVSSRTFTDHLRNLIEEYQNSYQSLGTARSKVLCYV